MKIKKEKKLLVNIKDSFQSKKFKGGAYATVTSLVVIILLVIINLFVTELDLKMDVSSEDLYSITDTTKEFLHTVTDDITVYYLAKTGEEDDTYTNIVEKYVSISPQLKLEYKDPVLYPKFASNYVEDTVNKNSILVVNNTNGRAKYIDNSELAVTEMDYNYYQSYISGVDVEGQLTKAISYVTTTNLPMVYQVEGHGETALSVTLTSALVKTNVTTNSLDTLKIEEIPEDCSSLLINAPKTDYTKDEVELIKDYLMNGGNVIIMADYNSEALTNFNSLLQYYGVSLVKGIVLEGNTNYYMGQYVNNLIPSINNHDITASITENKKSVVAPAAKGINVLDSKRNTITVEPLLTTSDDAYSKVNTESTIITKEDGDIDGPFYLAVAIKEEYNGITTNLVVYGSSYIIDESMTSYASIGNLDLFVNTIRYLSDMEDAIYIPSKSVVQQYLSLTSAQVNFWASIVIFIIPVVILSAGGYVCIKRRKK